MRKLLGTIYFARVLTFKKLRKKNEKAFYKKIMVGTYSMIHISTLHYLRIGVGSIRFSV
ncbi:hypothetical protein ACT7CW_03445 [Bacillus pacificus]